LTLAAAGAMLGTAMAQALTVLELSEQCGEPAERLLSWRSAGLIGTEGTDLLAPEDLQRIRLIQFLLRRGFELDAIARANRDAGLVTSYADLLSSPERSYSLDEAAKMLGWSAETLGRFLEGTGLNERGAWLDDEDLRALRTLKLAEEAGFPEDALVQLARVYTDALARVAEAEVRLFHFHVHERLKAQGLAGQALVAATAAARQRGSPMMEPALLYFHRRGLERAMQEDALLHLQEDADRFGLPGQLRAAIAFVDLASFTPMTDAMGDEAAAQVLDRYGRLVREAVRHHDGRVVKQIGDAFMLLFAKPRDAVTCALAIEGRSADESQFTAVRTGVHWGSVLYREGDYLGTTVNVAARLADAATRHQVLVTEAVRREVGGLPGVTFIPLGARLLKGLAGEVGLFEAVARTVDEVPERSQRSQDPVCGMELRPEEVVARLSIDGTERSFCSDECLRRFVAAPERYVSPRLTT
jgi:adenylate cyclase